MDIELISGPILRPFRITKKRYSGLVVFAGDDGRMFRKTSLEKALHSNGYGYIPTNGEKAFSLKHGHISWRNLILLFPRVRTALEWELS
jgi:hypothetical protein